MRLKTGPGMWEALDRKVRNQIRKAEKSGLVVERGGAELVGDFYDVFARNMRDLGTPVYSRRLFEEVMRVFPDRAQIHVVRLNGLAIAAGVTYRTPQMVQLPWASSLRSYNTLCPNVLLYWDAIQFATRQRRRRSSTWAARRRTKAPSSSRRSGAPSRCRCTGNTS